MSMTMASFTRILVRLKTAKSAEPKIADFSECVLSHFGFTNDYGQLYADLRENFLTLCDTARSEEDIKIPIKHPAFCPVLHQTANTASLLQDEIKNCGVDVGAAIILESSDGKVLLTRRAPHLRIFPGLWVPPGGHVEENESLAEAGIRELQEETGIDLKIMDCKNKKFEILGLWESVFPPMLALGPPQRHHIVVYFHAQLKDGMTANEMEKQISFNPLEVDACVWVDKEMISAIVQSYEDDSIKSFIHLPQFVRALTLDENQKQCTTDLPTAPLFNVLSSELNDTERVSTGTKFALQQYLKKFGN
ncbi:unnamed protein product [Lymnaea stagnalis]|uniref:m7GpppN-mRNA hydrolase NUDT17 n=1 Tax=Lymnaea stagnalis TaxID=6523 RepID=A0AAV2HVM3_LYMST